MENLISPSGIASGSGGRLIATDPPVVALAAAVSTAIRNYCGWHVAPRVTETKVFDGNGGTILGLPSLHVTSVDAVTVSGVDWLEQVEWSEIGNLRAKSAFPDRYRSVEVTFTHGYAIDEVQDLVMVGEQVARNAAASPMGIVRENLGSRQITLAQLAPGVAGGLTLLQRDLDILNQYRLVKRP